MIYEYPNELQEQISSKLFVSELNVLCQFDGARVVDGDGGTPHVVLPRVGAALSAAARGLLPPEGTPHFCAVGGDVNVHYATVGAVGADPL